MVEALLFGECFATIQKDFDYQFSNRGKGDLRIESLDYSDESFDMVMSHETIEHMYQLEGEGMLNTEGLINFWKEGYRTTKDPEELSCYLQETETAHHHGINCTKVCHQCKVCIFAVPIFIAMPKSFQQATIGNCVRSPVYLPTTQFTQHQVVQVNQLGLTEFQPFLVDL